jgi:hypothetical protein
MYNGSLRSEKNINDKIYLDMSMRKGDPFDWTRPPRITYLIVRSRFRLLCPGPEKKAESAESPQFCLIDRSTNARTSFVNGHESSDAPRTSCELRLRCVDQMLRPEIVKPRRLL